MPARMFIVAGPPAAATPKPSLFRDLASTRPPGFFYAFGKSENARRRRRACAPESLLKAIYESSIGNLPRAIREMDFVHVYDNSRWGMAPTVLLQADGGEVVYLAEPIPDWLTRVLGQL